MSITFHLTEEKDDQKGYNNEYMTQQTIKPADVSYPILPTHPLPRYDAQNIPTAQLTIEVFNANMFIRKLQDIIQCAYVY